jgi:hypothetical protein
VQYYAVLNHINCYCSGIPTKINKAENMNISNEELSRKCKSNMVINAAKSAIIDEQINEFLNSGGVIESVEGFKGVAKCEGSFFTKAKRKKQAFEGNEKLSGKG